MAQTRNQVLSLFGMSPDQIMQQEQEARRKEIAAIEDPYRRSGMQMGQQIEGMFGGGAESPDVTRARQLQATLQNVNMSDPDQMTAAAQVLHQAGFSNEALQLLARADDFRTTAQTRETSAAQQAQLETQAGQVQVPILTMKTTVNLDGSTSTTPTVSNVYVPKEQRQEFLDRFNQAMKGGGATDDTNQPQPDAITKTKTGAQVALIGGKYYLWTDEGGQGALVPDIKELGGLVDSEAEAEKKPEGEGVLDTIGSIVKGRNVGKTPDTPTVPKTTSNAEKERQARVAAKREDVIPDWLQGRRYD